MKWSQTQYALWNEELHPLLAKNGIRVHDVAKLTGKRSAWAQKYFPRGSFPDAHAAGGRCEPSFPAAPEQEPQPAGARAQAKGRRNAARYCAGAARFAALDLMPRGKGEDEPWEYIYLASLIKHHIAELFPGLILDGVHAFRVTRNSDLYIDEEEADNLLRSIEQELRRSSRGKAVRLEVEADCPKDFRELLLEFYELTERSLPAGRAAFHDPSHAAGRKRCLCQVEGSAFQPARDPALPAAAKFSRSCANRMCSCIILTKASIRSSN